MRKYIQKVKLLILVAAVGLVAIAPASTVNAATKKQSITTFTRTNQTNNFVKLASVDLSKILPYIMKNGDVIHEHKLVTYNNISALRLRIYNQNTGEVRYVYIDNNTGNILN